MYRSAVQLCLGLPEKKEEKNFLKNLQERRKTLTFAAAKKNGGLAQLARAPALHAGGQRFESVILHSVLIIVL